MKGGGGRKRVGDRKSVVLGVEFVFFVYDRRFLKSSFCGLNDAVLTFVHC